MTHHGLTPEDIEEVRRRTLAWAFSHAIPYSEIAEVCDLTEARVKDFMSGRSGAEGIVANLVAYLPLDLIYTPSKISPGPKDHKG